MYPFLLTNRSQLKSVCCKDTMSEVNGKVSGVILFFCGSVVLLYCYLCSVVVYCVAYSGKANSPTGAGQQGSSV